VGLACNNKMVCIVSCKSNLQLRKHLALMYVTVFYSIFQISEEDINNIIYLCDQVFFSTRSDPFLRIVSFSVLVMEFIASLSQRIYNNYIIIICFKFILGD